LLAKQKNLLKHRRCGEWKSQVKTFFHVTPNVPERLNGNDRDESVILRLINVEYADRNWKPTCSRKYVDCIPISAPRWRNLSINSPYASRRERGGFSARLYTMSWNSPSICVRLCEKRLLYTTERIPNRLAENVPNKRRTAESATLCRDRKLQVEEDKLDDIRWNTFAWRLGVCVTVPTLTSWRQLGINRSLLYRWRGQLEAPLADEAAEHGQRPERSRDR
jgi:hypothetical protein